MILCAFGRFQCGVETDFADDYVAELLSKFTAERQDIPVQYIISIRGDNSVIGKAECAGWHHSYDGKIHRVRYAENGVVLFTLEYDQHPQCIWVYVAKHNTRHLKVALQFGLLVALSNIAVGLHGVTLICRDRAVILSAPSGTGKTTLSKLLEKHTESGTVNGDFALLSCDTVEGIIFEPTPFCGTSNRCLNYRLKISGIVFLEQAEMNSWRKLSVRETLIRLLSNAFVPTWNEEIGALIEANILTIASEIPAWNFAFAPTEEAAKCFFNQLLSETGSFT